MLTIPNKRPITISNEGSHGSEPKLEVKSSQQHKLKQNTSRKLQDKVDVMAMYIFPAIFIFWNCFYWPYYLYIYIEEK